MGHKIRPTVSSGSVCTPGLVDSSRTGRDDGRDPGKGGLPLGADDRVAHAVKAEYEQALQVDRHHEHHLQHIAHTHARAHAHWQRQASSYPYQYGHVRFCDTL